MEILFLIIGLIIGAAAAGFIFHFKFKSEAGVSKSQYEQVNSQLNDLKIELSKWEERHKLLEDNYNKTVADLSSEREKVLELNSFNSSLKEINHNLEEKLNEQKIEIEEMNQKLKTEFENIANKILEEKSKKFTDQNKVNLEVILTPLKDKIKEFEKRVEETYDKEAQQRSSLKTEITKLYELNLQMSKEANNLTNALKGQTKIQGKIGRASCRERV